MSAAIGYILPIFILCSPLRTTTLEFYHITFSFWSLLISSLHDEIKTLFLSDPNLGDIKLIMKYILTPLGLVHPEKKILQSRFYAGGLLRNVLEDNAYK